jgi:hypothetical protein
VRIKRELRQTFYSFMVLNCELLSPRSAIVAILPHERRYTIEKLVIGSPVASSHALTSFQIGEDQILRFGKPLPAQLFTANAKPPIDFWLPVQPKAGEPRPVIRLGFSALRSADASKPLIGALVCSTFEKERKPRRRRT